MPSVRGDHETRELFHFDSLTASRLFFRATLSFPIASKKKYERNKKNRLPRVHARINLIFSLRSRDASNLESNGGASRWQKCQFLLPSDKLSLRFGGSSNCSQAFESISWPTN